VNRDKELKGKRVIYVKEFVASYKNKTTAIRLLSEKLFLSEKTIRRDLNS
jgi:DeoR/GlpR family transcriptional regulator of sugar metabolism